MVACEVGGSPLAGIASATGNADHPAEQFLYHALPGRRSCEPQREGLEAQGEGTEAHRLLKVAEQTSI
jgi:hypothetical protein